jgi:carbon-monoxide dehydrogenase iron sulfur subunit
MVRKKLIDREKCLGCRNCELACIAVHKDTVAKTAYTEGIETVERPRNKVQLDEQGRKFPEFCRHCDEPACVEACMSGALKKGDDGLVVVDHDICVGCYMCVMSCPYGMARPTVTNERRMIKCDGCRGREKMACVAACPQRCLQQVEEDSATGGHVNIKEGKDV